ncbi:REPRESSOR OF GA, REPRESSOR OF GA1-3 1, repressor of GA [Hibiscus trionum]|uniref:REPRESSOR OF GA, REPRESSOR OF GA1-3 1, repressor of GA n=1 Tax=Hibiscus trionum TaxID=183268 RepID=A0A9W7IMR6_HIBTR|nr:REPRESSOR OF GA, REPRESSOR OF GA1-3 1, repressor of GA [Hibiscus trionum]
MASSFSSRALEALVGCAEAIEAGDLRIADSRLDGILTLAAQQPKEAEWEVQVVKYFAEALVRRAYGLQHPAAANFSLHLCPPFFWIRSWWWWHGVIESIRVGIQKELMGKKRFHLIDFYIPHLYRGNGYLFDALPVPESCKNGQLSVRVSVVLPPCLKEIVNVERENDYLTDEAGIFNLIMEERLEVVYANSLSEVDASVLELGRRQDEAVLVFYSNKLQMMLGEEGVLEREFRKLRDINPDVVIISEQSVELHHSDYITHFKDSFHYYSLALQTYRSYIPEVGQYYRRQIWRGVRLQTLDQWTSRLEDAHFSQLPLNLDYGGVFYKNNNGCLVFTSDDPNHPLDFISAWKLRDLEPPLIPIRHNHFNPIGILFSFFFLN